MLNLDIINTATGKFGPPMGDSAGSVDPSTWGKVNILAQNNDITITTNEGKGTPMADIPSIFITSNGNQSLIQIDSRGRMQVQINKSINIVSETDEINITAEQDINLTSNKGDINIQTPNGVINLN